jgi:hypothetical protein
MEGERIMRKNRDKVLKSIIHEYRLLDQLVTKLKGKEWNIKLSRPISKDPWTIKDALAHITYWKSNTVRSIWKKSIPIEERGLSSTKVNHLIYKRWHNRSPKEVLAWHHKVQKEILFTLKEAPEEFIRKREKSPYWPGDLDSHSKYHRINDIELALKKTKT